MDLQVQLETLVLPVTMVLLANLATPVVPVSMAHLATTVLLALPELLATLVLLVNLVALEDMALATTAHHHVPLPDIKRRIPRFSTSFLDFECKFSNN